MKHLLVALFLMCGLTLASAQSNTGTDNPSYSGDAIGNGLNFGTANPLFAPVGSMSGLSGSFGVSFWLKTANTTAGFESYISNTTGVIPFGWQFFYRTQYNDAFTVQFALSGNTTNCFGGSHMCVRNQLVNDGNWHHLCVSYTTSGSFFMVDGQLKDQSSGNANYNPNGNYLTVSQAFHPATSMRDIMLRQNGVFKKADCALIYHMGMAGLRPNSGRILSDLYARWPLDNCDTVGCADISGNGRNLIYDTPPAVSILTPSAGNVSGNVSLTASCTDIIKCTSVAWFVDGVSVGSSATSPYTVTWKSTQNVDGAHVITATATNAGGATSSTTVNVTSVNSIAAINWYFSPVGVHGNDCQSTGTACPIADFFGAAGTRFYLGGDTIHFDAGHGAFALTTSSPFLCDNGCGASQNAVSGGSSYPITLTSYGGSGGCVPLAGTLTGCVILGLDPSSTLTHAMQLQALTNVIVQNFQFIGGTAASLSGTQYNAGIVIFNQYNGANLTITNNLFKDWANGIWNHTFTGSMAAYIVSDNSFTGTSTTTTIDSGNFQEGNIAGNFTSNVCSNIGGRANTGSSGQCFLQDQNFSQNAVINYTIQDNVAFNQGANLNTCGASAFYWTHASAYDTFQFNEGYNYIQTGGCDGGLYDLDYSTNNMIVQYSYGHNMWGYCGSMLNANDGGGPSNDLTIRFLICENAAVGATSPSGAFGFAFDSASPQRNKEYGNTVYTTRLTSTGEVTPGGFVNPIPLCMGDTAENSNDALWANNICIKSSHNGTRQILLSGTTIDAGLTMLTNDYYWLDGGATTIFTAQSTDYPTVSSFRSATGKEVGSIQLNPLIVGVGSGGTCYTGTGIPAGPQPCPANYQTTHGSPVIGIGTNVNSLGATGTQDYYGNALGNGVGTGWNIGADGAHH